MSNVHHLILTVDYELFGDGSGCFEHCVVNPAAQMASISDACDAPLTVFAEVLEIDAALKHGGAVAKGAEGAERQLVELWKQGHDVQLHIHPQWIGARHDGETWQLDMKRWRCGSLTAREFQDAVEYGVEWLSHRLGSSAAKRYACVAFRAGGWCVQGAPELLQTLKSCGIRLESSVAPGLYSNAPGAWFDFRNAPARAWWPVEDDVLRVTHSSDSLLEVPILTGRYARLAHLRELVARRRAPTLATGCRGGYAGPAGERGRIMYKLDRVAALGQTMLDLSTLPAARMIALVEQWLELHADASTPVPLVAIGHTKNFTRASAREFEAFLGWASRRADIQFSTFGRWLQEAGVS